VTETTNLGRIDTSTVIPNRAAVADADGRGPESGEAAADPTVVQLWH